MNKPQKLDIEQRKQIVGTYRCFTLQKIGKLQSYMSTMDVHGDGKQQLGTVIPSGEEGGGECGGEEAFIAFSIFFL